ncbi:hypothetical protein J6590_095277 [Homalodisca vitripennis]|nr:hypothetical protein J6590_095277 [Homalodisca vitripennis]
MPLDDFCHKILHIALWFHLLWPRTHCALMFPKIANSGRKLFVESCYLPYCPHLTCLRARGEGDEGEDSPPQTIRHRCPGNGATSHLRTFAREYLGVESCDFTSAPQICIITF